MPSQTLTPAEAASLLAVNVQTVRRWTTAHAAHLSPEATQPPRRLTSRDVEVLRHVATLRAQGYQESAINERLANISFVEVEEASANAQENRLQRFATAAQTAQDGLLLPVAIDGLDKRLDAVQRQVDRLERNQRERVSIFIAGVGVGLVAAILLLLAAYLLATI